MIDWERNVEIYTKLKKDGVRQVDVAKEYGLSRQRIQAISTRIEELVEKNANKKQEELDSIIFPKLREWMKEHSLDIRMMATIIDVNESKGSRFRKFLSGEGDGGIDIIWKLMVLTGYTFEELFQLEEKK